jgi:antitoxin YefM
VFEVRSIAVDEHLYTLSKLSIDWLGFGRSWLIRWRSLRFAESIFGVMVLGLPPVGYANDYLRYATRTNIAPLRSVSYNRHTRLGNHCMTSSEISYTEAQSNLGVLLDRVADNKDIIIVKRDGTDKNVALIAETDLSSLLETVYLLRSPANAARLHRAIDRAKQRDLQGYSHSEPENPSESIATLCEELGIVR